MRTRQTAPKKVPPHIAGQALANLTPVDVELLLRLYDLRYVRTATLARLLYPDRSDMWVWQRLRELSLRGLIANLRVREGRSFYAYWHLDEVGLRAAEELQGIPPEERTAIRDWRVSATYARHFADAADFYAAVASQSWLGFTWLNHRTAYEYGTRTDHRGREVPALLHPDATILLTWMLSDHSQQGTWTFYVEIDRSSMPLKIMGEKFDKYVGRFTQLMPWDAKYKSNSYANGKWKGNLDVGHYLLILCRSEARAQNLQRLIDERRLPGCAVATREHALLMLSGELPRWWRERISEES